MNSTNFCYWLQGYCEIYGQLPTPKQWEIIKDHLKLVVDTERTKDSKTVFCNSEINNPLPLASCVQLCADCKTRTSLSGICKKYFWLCWECDKKKDKAVKCKTKDCINKSTSSSGYCYEHQPIC